MRSHKLILCMAFCLCLLFTGGGALGEAAAEAAPPIFHLNFDEGGSHLVHDQAGTAPDGNISYRFLNAVYTENMEPSWRSCGVEGGALLFDGSSTCIIYPKEALSLGGSKLSFSVWAAPRAFEWDAPDAAENGTAHLTALLGQYSPQGRQGFLLVYQRFGEPCFQAGDGENWYTLWAGEERLARGEWNHLAAVFDGEKGFMSLYLNGALCARQEIPTGSEIARAVNEGLAIGKNAYGERIAAGDFQMFAGLMDDLKIYDTALGEAEIAVLAGSRPGPIPGEEIALEDILGGDVYRPRYHAAPRQHWMNEPHAPLYYNGMYHLFFQSNCIGPYWRNISWGHFVSGDTVHWRQVADALVPTENSVAPDGVWSGGATLDRNGVPILFFTAGNDSFRDTGLLSNQNIGAAWPRDLSDPELKEWVMMEELAIAQQPGQGRPGEFRDPSVWREEDGWYMLICSGSANSQGGTALLYHSDKLELLENGTLEMDWQYRGPIWEMPNQSMVYGTSWELPILLPLGSGNGETETAAFLFSPAPASIADNKVYYFLGDFDRATGRFTPDEAFGGLPRMLDYGKNVFTGPSILQDPETGRICLFSIMQDQRSGPEQGAAGWAHTAGLTRNLSLNAAGDDLAITPDPRLYSLLDQPLVSLRNTGVEEVNAALEEVRGDLLYIRAELRPGEARRISLLCKTGKRKSETAFTYDAGSGRIEGSTRNRGKDAPVLGGDGELLLKDGKLEMEIFIDRSLVEGFFNGEKALSIRSYDHPEAQSISLEADGALEVLRLEIYSVKPI